MKSSLRLFAFTAALASLQLHAAPIAAWSTDNPDGSPVVSTANLPAGSVIPEPTLGLLIGTVGIVLLSFRRR